jgi:hypothetical protein
MIAASVSNDQRMRILGGLSAATSPVNWSWQIVNENANATSVPRCPKCELNVTAVGREQEVA